MIDRIKISENFYLDEYIPKELYMSTENKTELLSLIDPVLIESDQKLRYVFGEITINNWFIGGDRIYSGFRPINCKIGAKGSDHKFGKASDKLFKNATPQEVRKYIKSNYKSLKITKIEDDISWVHTSVAKTGEKYLVIFYS